MEKKHVEKMMRGKIISVVRCKEYSLAEKISESLISNGIKVIEVTYTVPDAGELIKKLKKTFPDTLIGAGTILSQRDAEDAVNSGADFIVTPCIVDEVCLYCKEKAVFCSMGTATPTEAFKAYSLGADIVKLFPGSSFSPSYVRELKGPFPFIDIMPTGGVNEKNIKEWFDNGAYAVGLGGYFTKGIDESNLSEISSRVEKLLNALK